MRRAIGVRWVLAAAAVAVVAGCSSGGSDGAAAPASSTTSTTMSSTTTSTTTAMCSTSSSTVAGSSGKEVNPPGDIPDNQAFVAYAPATGGYTVQVPEGWARRDDGGAVTFTDKFNSVRVEVVAAPAAPTVASARSSEVPTLAVTPCFEVGDVTMVHRKGGDAVRVTYRADGPADPVTGKVVRDAVERYEFWRGGQEAILTLSGAVGADNVDPWRIVSDSFAWR